MLAAKRAAVTSAAARRFPAAAQAVAGVDGEIFDQSQLDQQPVPVTQARPRYPTALRQAGSQGQAVVEFVVAADGTVTGAKAVNSTDPEFAEAAVAAVQQWQFKPGQLAGQPVGTRLQVPIVFSIVNDSGNWF